MNEELCMQARTTAGNYFRQGYNCAESIFLTFQPYLAPPCDVSLVRMATPFGGGIGRSGCVCGALAGATLVIGLQAGRTAPDVPHDTAYKLGAAFQAIFAEQFGATCCRALKKHPFDTAEQGRACLKIVGTTARLLMAFLQEHGIITLSHGTGAAPEQPAL
ncbi:MAG: C-GCAxxG-C-C family protein [Desulfobacterota bacterium]|nr:C-GCAxxG-C-C family protein [Thermodesulfobacteriota bacterium]